MKTCNIEVKGSNFNRFIIYIAEFRRYFEQYGRVISAEVMFNRETHKSRGFGFIVFEKEESAVNVCSEKEHHSIDAKLVCMYVCMYYLL